MPAHAPGVGIGVVFAPTWTILLSLLSKNHDNRHCQVEACVRRLDYFNLCPYILCINVLFCSYKYLLDLSLYYHYPTTKEHGMPIIRPISDLRNNFSSISEIAHSDNEPVFLTKNGIGDLVVMSLEYYDQQLAKLELYQKLNEAREEIKRGAKGKNARKVLESLIQS